MIKKRCQPWRGLSNIHLYLHYNGLYKSRYNPYRSQNLHKVCKELFMVCKLHLIREIFSWCEINNNFEIQTVKLRPHQTAGIQFLKSHFLQRIGLPSTPVNLLTEKWFKVRPVHTNHDISSWTVQIRVDGYGLNTLPYITLDKTSKISTFVFLHIQLEACAVLFCFSGKVICTTVLWINCLTSKQTFI